MATSELESAEVCTGASVEESTENFVRRVHQELGPAVRKKERNPGDEPEIGPDDSISNQGSVRGSRASSRSAQSERVRAMRREVELAARAAVIKRRHEIENKKRELQRNLEQKELQLRTYVEQQKAELDYKNEELQLEADLEAAKVLTRMLDDECHEVDSIKSYKGSSPSDSVIRAIIRKRAEELKEVGKLPRKQPTTDELEFSAQQTLVDAADKSNYLEPQQQIAMSAQYPTQEPATAHQTKEESRLAKERNGEMHKDIDEEREPWNCVDSEVGAANYYKAAEAVHARTRTNIDSLSRDTSSESSSCTDTKYRPGKQGLHVTSAASAMEKPALKTHTANIGIPEKKTQRPTTQSHNIDNIETAPQMAALQHIADIHSSPTAVDNLGHTIRDLKSVKLDETTDPHAGKGKEKKPELKPTVHFTPTTDECMDGSVKSGQDLLLTILDKLVSYQKESFLPSTDLEYFDGSDLLKYPAFIKNFKLLVEEGTNNDTRRLELLLKYTKGEAHQLIEDCALLEPREAYSTALALLRRDYGHPAALATAYRQRAERWPQIPNGDKEALRKFAIFLNNICQAKKTNHDLCSMDGYDFLRTVARKLPIALQQKWIEIVGKCRDEKLRSPTFEDFEQFVTKLSRNQNDPRIEGLGYQKRVVNDQKHTQHSKGLTKRQVYSTSVFQKGNRGKITQKNPGARTPGASEANQGSNNFKPGSGCTYCGPDTKHSILECRKLGAMKLEERAQFCRNKGLCFACMKPGHMKRKCRNPEKCTTCGKKHPTPLHNPRFEYKEGKSETNVNNEVEPIKVTTACVSAGCTTSRMTILPVTVTAAGGPCVQTYAFLDSGCGAVFASPELCEKLHVRTKNTKLLLKTLADEQICETQVVQDQLQVGDVQGISFVDLPDVFVKEIPVTNEDIPKQREIDKWVHLKDIRLPRLEVNKDTYHVIPSVSLMIGSNIPAASQPLEIITGRVGEPYAVKSPLGWMIHGLVTEGTQKSVAAHFCKVRNTTSIQRSDEHLEELFTSYVNRDFDEKPGIEVRPSVEDKKFLKLMEETIEQEPDGHYQTALPFRDRNTVMPNNRTHAEAYANSLRKRLVKDKNLCEQYTQFMNDLEAKGYAERVPEQELVREDGRQWYIPHHGVFNPHKPGKIRVVYNCPAACMGVSLNKQLLQGPDLTNRLTGVLMRWRQEPVAVLADIESMFYQVRVAKEDRDMMRYLWWPGGNLNKDLQDYRMCVHVFGAVSSPSCANYVLRKIAEDCENRKPRVTETILNSFYVDDMLKSFSTEEEAIEVSKSVQETLQAGGFRLTKWFSNNREVIESFPAEERAKEVKHLDLDVETLPTDRALGIQWNAETDQLGFSWSMNEKWGVVTRRSLLSIVSGIYDPMGMIAPFTIKAKIILQTLCQAKIGWDDRIPQQQADEWTKWTQELPRLEEVKLNRCLKPASITNPTNIQLHHFADASERGYGVVSYVRYLEGTQIHCSFLMSKARVRPLKMITIPRLELTAAVTAVRVDSRLRSEWRMSSDDELISSYFWTDSLTVLKYIRNETSRFHTFVANRVEEIREKSEPSQWHYVPTQYNPADDCSRGLTMEKLLKSDRWFHGPCFLWKEEVEWPKCKLASPESLSTADPEVRKSKAVSQGSPVKVGVGVVKHIESQDPVTRIINYFSDWMKLKRIVAWWLRLKGILQRKSKKQETRQQTKHLTVEETQQAEEAIIKIVQQQAFPTEISALQKNREPREERINNEHGEAKNENTEAYKIHSRSTILNLDPILRNGLLRVGGRLGKAQIPEDAKHQLILPRNNHVSDLILDYIHRQCNHQGRNHILASSRQKYWILGAGVKVKGLMKRCVICRKQRCQMSQQMMADLPAQRVKSDDPPFAYSGMDYFGPFEIKYGRTTRKRYGVLFTCMNCRAVHIEIADSMNTSSCINAIRRFLARRGHHMEITSDNGSNLVGSNRELREALKELDEEAIQMFACNHGIKWNFNTPTASHQGGVWERMIEQ